MVGIIFGPPGSGKGTQAARVEQAFGLKHLSTGDLLRAEAERDTPIGREATRLMAAGELVPDDLIVRIVEDRVHRDRIGAGVLLDGFPRTLEQAHALDSMLARDGRKVDFVVALEAPEDVVVGRLLGRSSEQERVDDTPEAIRERLREHYSLTTPVLDYYRDTGVPIEKVDAVGSVDEVFERVKDVLLRRGS